MNTVITFFSWLDIYIQTFKKAKVQEKTFVNSKYYVNMIKNNCEDIVLKNANDIYFQEILNIFADKGYARGTIQKIRCIILIN